MLGTGQAGVRELRDDLRGVRHARVGEVNVGESVGAEDTQAVVRVRESHARARAGGQRSQAQYRTLDRADGGTRTVEETRPKDEREILLARSIHHRCRIGRFVLPVGVEGDDVAGTAREGRLKAGLQRRALAEVDGMGSSKGARSAGESSSVIGRRVIDDEHTREKGANAATTPPITGASLNAGMITHVSERICIRLVSHIGMGARL